MFCPNGQFLLFYPENRTFGAIKPAFGVYKLLFIHPKGDFALLMCDIRGIKQKAALRSPAGLTA